MSKVYVVNFQGHNIHMAKRYGDVVYLTTGNVNPFTTDRHLMNIAQQLIGADENDYFLLSGTPSLVFMTAVLLVVKAISPINILLWNAKKGDYELRRLHLNTIKEMLKEVKDGRSDSAED